MKRGYGLAALENGFPRAARRLAAARVPAYGACDGGGWLVKKDGFRLPLLDQRVPHRAVCPSAKLASRHIEPAMMEVCS